MARKKTEEKATKQTPSTGPSRTNNILSQIKFGESYTSLLLGIVVVIIVAILVIAFARDRNTTPTDQREEVTSDQTADTDEVTLEDLPATYTVKEGEDLWGIAERVYGSGYNWVDIAEASNLTSPDQLETGMELTLPDVEPKEKTGEAAQETTPTPQAQNTQQETTQQQEQAQQPAGQQKGEQVQNVQTQPSGEKITGTSYKVQEGDNLWEIAVRAYGDGYKWVEIANVNQLANPHYIFVGTELNLPRTQG